MHVDPDDPDPSTQRPWILLVLAGVCVWLGLDQAARREDSELTLALLGFGAFFVALFFFPDLRELMRRWPWRD